MGCGLQPGFGLGQGNGNSQGNASASMLGGNGGRSRDNFYGDVGQIPMGDEKQGAGSTSPFQIQGQRQDQGKETFIEVKGPSGLGSRSKTPYYKVLPGYKKRAEEALNKNRIPKEHEKRVKEYFNSLQGGGK